jgi:phosphopantetheinyl transferase/acyl carrier protein
VTPAFPLLLAASSTPLGLDQLTPGERAAFSALPPAGPRRHSWLMARRALRMALAASGRPADTSQFTVPGPVMSLSHTAQIAVAAVTPAVPAAVTGVGVDIETERTPRPAGARFFLAGSEQRWLAALPEAARPGALLRLWTVKEALFKSDVANDRASLRDYEVAAPRAYLGYAARDQHVQFRYRTVAVPHGFLSVAIALSDSWRTAPMRMADFDQMAAQISSLISVPLDRLTPETTIAELVPDSFMFIEVAVDLQEEYDVVLDQDDLKGLRTLGDLATLLRSRQEAPSGG